MTTGKTLIFIGGLGFFVCLGLLLLRSQELSEHIPERIDLAQEALLISSDIAPMRAQVRDSQLAIDIPEDALFFAFDDSTLAVEAQSKLRRIFESVRDRYKEYEVRVVGHADGQGDSTYNKHLGQRRADAVAQFLLASGLAVNRLHGVSSMGEAAPLASNDSEEGRQINRRVEINILPLVKAGFPGEGTTGGLEDAIAEDDTEKTPGGKNPFVEVLQEHPFFVILGCLSSCITVAGGLSELNNYRRRRRRRA
jgi:outer membrane protein OmpA-like peptidoglycan-associated protein